MRLLTCGVFLCGVCCSIGLPQEPRLTFYTDERRFSFGVAGGPALERARFGLDVDGKTYWAEQASQATWDGSASGPGRLSLRFDQPGVLWIIHVRRGTTGVPRS